jgi:hypothetical protein
VASQLSVAGPGPPLSPPSFAASDVPGTVATPSVTVSLFPFPRVLLQSGALAQRAKFVLAA